WFVEHQNVWLLQHELAEQDACSLAAGEHVSLFVGFIAGEEHLPEQAANFFVRDGRIPLEKPVKDCHARLNEAAMVLGKESYCRFMSPVDFASAEKWPVVAGRLPQFGLRRRGRVGQKRIEQCRFPGAVAAHESNLLSAGHARREVVDD